jgi:TonB family protein
MTMRPVVAAFAISIILACCTSASAQQPTPIPSPPLPECSVQAYKATELDRKAKILEYPHPDFDTADVEKYRNSVVVLRGLLCGSGKVTNLKVIQGVSDRVDEEAIKTAKKIKFKPAQKDGRDVSQWLNFEYRLMVWRYRE